MTHKFLFLIFFGLGLFFTEPRAEGHRHLNTAVLDSLRQERAISYSDPQSPVDQFLKELWAEGWEWLAKHIFRKATRDFWEGMGYLIVILFLVYLVHLTLSGRFYPPLSRNREVRAPEAPLVDNPEDVDTEALNVLLQQAVRNRKWPFATHLLYVRLLKHLMTHKRISWHAAKTNHDYIRELNPEEFKEAFIRLTQNFEDVWYGGRPMDEESFRDFENGCTRLERETEQARV